MPEAVAPAHDETDAPATEPRVAATSPRVPRAPFILVAVTVVLLAIAVAVRAQNPEEGLETPLNGTVLAEPQPRPDFTLTDTEGRPFDFGEETAGELTLLFFGYTSCPDVCPLHLANLGFALDRPGVPRPTVVFVGVDTKRDTPDAIRTFLDRFDSQFIGLTGTEEKLRIAQEAANVSVAITEEPEKPGGDYLVGHSAQVIAYTADDQSHVVYPFGVRQEDWIEDLPVLARNEWDAS